MRDNVKKDVSFVTRKPFSCYLAYDFSVTKRGKCAKFCEMMQTSFSNMMVNSLYDYTMGEKIFTRN